MVISVTEKNILHFTEIQWNRLQIYILKKPDPKNSNCDSKTIFDIFNVQKLNPKSPHIIKKTQKLNEIGFDSNFERKQTPLKVVILI